jgi:hypothetical protein
MGNKEVEMRRLKLFIVIFFVLLSKTLFSQENIEAVKEHLINIPLGNSKGEIEYDSNEEGFFSAGSPFVDNQGRLIFGSTDNETCKLIISQDKIQESNSDKRKISIIGTPFVSQGEMGIASGNQYLLHNDTYLTIDYHKYHSFFDWDENYPMPFGALLYSEKNGTGIAVVFDVKHPSEDFTIVGEDKLKSWLPTQPGGFSIGDDGLLYRNGVVWSAVKDKTIAGNFVGRLASGHTLWDSDGRVFHILNSMGKIEVDIEIPWSEHENRRGFNPQNYGIGPWGEIYFLIAPFWDMSNNKWPQKDSSSELVVVRNHLKYFGRLNDDKVRLRKGPSISTESLGTYPDKTGFRILEKGTAEETIGGRKNVWYKVRLLDGTEGWFFGAFVHNLYDGPDGNPPPWPNVEDW